MQNRITRFQERRGGEPQPIGEIITELPSRYQSRFPGVRIAVVRTPEVTGGSKMLVLSRRPVTSAS